MARSSDLSKRNQSILPFTKKLGVESQKDIVDEVMADRNMRRYAPKEIEISNEIVKMMGSLRGEDLLEFVRQHLRRNGLLAMSFFKWTPSPAMTEERRHYSGDMAVKLFGSRERLAEEMKKLLENGTTIGAGFELQSTSVYEGDIIIYKDAPQKPTKKDEVIAPSGLIRMVYQLR